MSPFTEQEISQRQMLERKYAVARRDIIILFAFTLFNIVLAVTKSNLYFLFSAYIPYTLVEMGMLLCGMLPETFYEALYDAPYHTLEFADKSVFFVLLLIGLVLLFWYWLSWKLTKKKTSAGWLIFVLVYFVVDTVAMVIGQGFSVSAIFDYVFHGWMIYSLISGILAARKLKWLPEEIVEAVTYAPVSETPEA